MRWQKHKNIIIFVLVTIIGVGLFWYGKEKNGWVIFNMLGASSALALSILAFLAYIEYAKGEDTIKIYFKAKDGRKIYTKLFTQRKYFTRGEVLGLLRMIQKEQKLFQLEHFNQKLEILNEFNKIQTGKQNELIIDATRKELDQFWLLSERENNKSIHKRIKNQ